MGHRFLLWLSSCVLLACSLAEYASAGPQKDAVCQGGCGGGCGPCPIGGGVGGGAVGGGGLVGIGQILALPFTILEALAPAQPSGPSPAEIANNKGVDAFNRRDWASAAIFFRQSLAIEPNDAVVQKNLANALNHDGVDAYNKGDYSRALDYFSQALASDPVGDPDRHFITEDIAAAEGRLAEAQRIQDQRRQEKITATTVTHSIQDLTRSLDAAAADGGMDFDSPGRGKRSEVAGAAATKVRPSLGDTMIVDARNVPSGLPKFVDNAIASTYADAPPGVSDRVRKGFQAVTTHDWKLAMAWFQDALNHDPDSANLKRLVALADYTERHRRTSPPGAAPSRFPVQQPEEADMELLFPDLKPTKGNASGKDQAMQMPEEVDLDILFPGNRAAEARALNDYMIDGALKMTENDPVLLRALKPH